MHLTRLVSLTISFTIIFAITSVLVTIKHLFVYLSKMFDLPADIIESLLELNKNRDENKNKEV